MKVEKPNEKHYWLACLLVKHVSSMHANLTMATDNSRLTRNDLAGIINQTIIEYSERNNVPQESVNAYILSVNYIGHMTEQEFEGNVENVEVEGSKG